MTIEISAFAWVPPFAQGYVKDIRPRWALAEAGLSYTVRLLSGDPCVAVPGHLYLNLSLYLFGLGTRGP